VLRCSALKIFLQTIYKEDNRSVGYLRLALYRPTAKRTRELPAALTWQAAAAAVKLSSLLIAFAV
jgi:hypothetical protein